MRKRVGIALLTFWAMAALGCGASSAADSGARAQKEYELAVGLVGEKNVAGAFEHLFTAVELNPDNAEAQLLLGNLYMFRGDFEVAERHMRIALKTARERERYGQPMVAEIQNALGVVLVHRGSLKEATAVLRDSASNLLNRHPHLSWGNLGWAYMEAKQYEKAIEALSQSVRQEPGFCLGYYRLGKTYLEQKDYKNAEVALTSAIESDDAACRALQDGWRLRGAARAQLGMRNDAIADFEHCVELAADNDAGRSCQEYLEAAH